MLSAGFQRSARPDVFVAAAKDPFRQVTAVACPDPHVERWYMADPQSFAEVVGKVPRLRRRKCDRDCYKEMLTRLVAASGHPSTLGGIESAHDLVEAMDLYRAGKNAKSLKHFVDDLRTLLRRR